MLTSLEVLLNAESSLMDEDAPYDFAEWHQCTCGHIYHGVNNRYGEAYQVRYLDTRDPYMLIMKELTELLNLPVVDNDYAEAISHYTKIVSGLYDPEEPYMFPYSKVTREDSLKVVREAIAKIREMDEAVIVKSLDAHDYEVL